MASVTRKTRRQMLKDLGMVSAASCLFPGMSWAGDAQPGSQPRRIIFFLQNHGLDPRHVTPTDIDIPTNIPLESIDYQESKGQNVWRKTGTPFDTIIDVALDGHPLPPWTDPLEPIKDKITLLHGLNGRHISPFHGAPYGCLGAYRAGKVPRGETIDCALGRVIPGVLPLLSVGLGRRSGIATGVSAWAAQKPVPMQQGAMAVYNSIFGLATSDRGAKAFEAETDIYDFLQHDADALSNTVPLAERRKIETFEDGVTAIARRRRQLAARRDALKAFAPATHDILKTAAKDTIPAWEAHLANAMAVLKAGITNVITLSAGMARSGDSWAELGIETRGHAMGHTDQAVHPDWLTLRRYNMRLLLQMVRCLEAEAEPGGNGTMMDHTLIVYTSCHGETHHSVGNRWPFVLIGNLGGRLRTGRYIHYPVTPSKTTTPYKHVRTVNAFYATLLHAVGKPVDWFNHESFMQELEPAGPLSELLA